MANNFGFELDTVCWRNGCQGVICERVPEGGCSCHISPPCSWCTTEREWCPECGWKASDKEYAFNGFMVRDNPEDRTGAWLSAKPRPLDPRKLDYRSKSHTNSSMIKEGVYPETMTQVDVEREVRGTFGGRFQSFGGGKFSYIAYTD